MTEYYIGLEGGLNPDKWFAAPNIKEEHVPVYMGTLPENHMYLGRIANDRHEWLVNIAGHWAWSEAEVEIDFVPTPPWVEPR